MLAKIGIKLLTGIVGMAGLAFVAWDYINTKQSNAVLEATLSSTTQAMMDYATNAEEEITGYASAVKILGDRDGLARNERDEEFANIENRNLTKMAKRKPDMLARVLSRRTARLLGSLANDRSGAGIAADAAANAPRRAEPEAD
ncbi:MAG: hypothetical protein L3J21_09740 [Devosiaceae bacterium]|nr:hypothetical protein [Devosiaceae bacterium]